MRTIPATINRFWVWIMLLVFGMVCLTETSCSKKAPKYPEDHARFQRVVQAIKTLETAYVNKDTPAIHELLLPLEQLEILEAVVIFYSKKKIRRFRDVSITGRNHPQQ